MRSRHNHPLDLQPAGPGHDGRALPAEGRYRAPTAMDTGSVDQGRVTFPNWKGDADRPAPQIPTPRPPSDRVGIAVIGLGRLSLERILPALAASRHARVAALVSGSPEKARVVAGQYGVAADAVLGYDQIHELAARNDVQAVYVVTPNGLHKTHVLAAAQAGKHVLCEKPMANTSDEAKEMVRACKDAGVQLMVAYRCQYEPFNREAARLVQQGGLGAPRIIEACNTQAQGPEGQWRFDAGLAGGGALPDIGLYCVNGVRALLADNPVEVFAQIVNPRNDARYNEVDETMSFMMRFASGAIANCACSYGAHESKDLRVRLERGWIDLENAFAYEGQRMRVAHREGDQQTVNDVRLSSQDAFRSEIDHFAQCLLEGKPVRTPGEEGVQDHLVMEALYQSAREGRPVLMEADSRHRPVAADQA